MLANLRLELDTEHMDFRKPSRFQGVLFEHMDRDIRTR